MILSICVEGACLGLCLVDSRRFIGEISGDDSAADEDWDEDGGVFAKLDGGGICKRGLRAARRATAAWREGDSFASL